MKCTGFFFILSKFNFSPHKSVNTLLINESLLEIILVLLLCMFNIFVLTIIFPKKVDYGNRETIKVNTLIKLSYLIEN